MRKQLDFIKAHYEKVILSVVLIGLAAAAALMPMKVSEEQAKEEERRRSTVQRPVQPMEPIVLTNALETLARVSQPTQVQLAGDHNVFNPVKWQKRPDGGIMKMAEAGISSLKITNIEPLMLRVSFRRTVGSAAPYKYEIGIANEALRNPSVRPRLGEIGEANSMFKIEAVRGANPENPAEIELVLEGERTPITVAPNKPFERVAGYAADFHHEKLKQTWKKLKAGDDLTFGGESYNIVAITEDEAVLSAKSNKKQTTIEYKPPQ